MYFMECFSCIIAAHTCPRISFQFSFLSFAFSIHNEIGAWFFSYFYFLTFSLGFWGYWLNYNIAVYHRSKSYLKYYNLAISGWSEWLAPASMWALLFSNFFGRWQVSRHRQIQWLAFRDFKTKACLQACVFATLHFDFLPRGFTMKYNFFLPPICNLG